MSREELRKTGPLEDDQNDVLSAAFNVEDIERASATWADAGDIPEKAQAALSALNDLLGSLAAWFERNDPV